jgi:DNA modification methylase
MVLYAVKGKRPTNYIAPDLFSFPPDDNLGHAAQKPVVLFEELLRRSVRPGNAVCDPFAGTGPIIPAAHAFKCRATAIEIDPAAYGIAVTRLETLK